MNRLNSVAVVTGAAQGIGRAVVEDMVKLGIKVVAIDIQKVRLSKLIEEFSGKGHDIVGFDVDVTDRRLIQQTIKSIESNIGDINILINVAGILKIDEVDKISDNDWDETFAVNTTGVFNISREVIKYMKERKSGVIITVGSNSANIPRIGMSAYAASKSAVISFTKTMALELAKYNIRCNVVSPGSTDTEMLTLLGKERFEKILSGSLDDYKLGIPLKKLAKPSDISSAIMFLISEKSNHITMQNICIDGGATLGV